ncbi:MAG: flagellar hook-length control protein FliK [Deltaproteobacteria bacterium]
MTSNMFMLPVPPQIPASGFNGTDTKGPAAFKSGPSGESSDPGTSFSATLNRISERQHNSNQKAAPSGKPGTTSRGSNTDSASSQKMGKTTDHPHDHMKKVETSGPKETAPFVCPISGFGLMPSHPVDPSIAEDGSSAVEPLSGATTTPDLNLLADLIGLLNAQQQNTGEQMSIGAFEQLQTGISPEAINRALLEQLAFSTVPQGDGEGAVGRTARLFAFWQWMFSSPSTALDGALNGQPEPSGINGNTPPNPLQHMSAVIATGPEELQLDAALLLKMVTLSQPAQSEISENPQMAVDGHVSRLSSWAAGDAISETLLEAQTRQMSENSQRLAVQTAVKTDAEQTASPNSAGEGLTARLPEEVFDIKSAVQKSEMLALDARGDKISRIDGDGKDSGFLFAQDQMPPNLARLENGAQSTEAAPRGLLSQTLNQIVQKAVLSFQNGQHEIQLHLKPDYLGHIRMQIVSEGHHVGIKIAAEFPFVKDMLESNLHQLKADLQAQGLNIDELEVSVAHDSHAGGDLHQNAAASRLQAVKNRNEGDDGSAERPAQTQSPDGGAMAQSAVDYFA